MSRMQQPLRLKTGSFIAEAPLALWVLFFIFTFPLLDMACVLLRYTFVVSATRDGVHAAAHSKTFFTNASARDSSAVNAASSAVALTASSFSEIQINNVSTQILVTDISTQQVSQSSLPLQQPADTDSNLYELQTVVQANINPLINMNIGILPVIPGLTAAMPVTVAAREYCEYPQGLNQ